MNQKYIGRVPKHKINAVPMLYAGKYSESPSYLRPFSFATFQTIIVFFPGLNHQTAPGEVCLAASVFPPTGTEHLFFLSRVFWGRKQQLESNNFAIQFERSAVDIYGFVYHLKNGPTAMKFYRRSHNTNQVEFRFYLHQVWSRPKLLFRYYEFLTSLFFQKLCRIID